MSRKITYLPSLCERPSPSTRPSCTATTEAFGALSSSTNCGVASAVPAPAPVAAPVPLAASAATAGAGAGTEPGVDPAAVEPLVPACAAESAVAGALDPGVLDEPATAFA